MYCSKCGAQMPDNASFCTGCGAPLKNNINQNVTPVLNTSSITARSIPLAIILSIVTCGIYAIYWFVKLTDEMNQISGQTTDTSGGVAFLLSLVTCGIYTYYWAYKLGKKRDIVAGESDAESSGIIYLILCLFGFGIVAYCLAQDTINKAVGNP